MGAAWAGRLPQGSCSRRSLRSAVAACVPMLVLLALQAPSMVLGEAPVIAGRIVSSETQLLNGRKAHSHGTHNKQRLGSAAGPSQAP